MESSTIRVIFSKKEEGFKDMEEVVKTTEKELEGTIEKTLESLTWKMKCYVCIVRGSEPNEERMYEHVTKLTIRG